MKVRDLIRELENLKEGMKDKEIFVMAENGMLLPPEIRFRLKNAYDVYDHSAENVVAVVLSWR